MMEQPVAVYAVPCSEVYVTIGTGVFVVTPMGPKFVPLIVIDAPPDVDWPNASTDVSTGAMYAVVATEAALCCPPTVTCHVWPVPNPGKLRHVILV